MVHDAGWSSLVARWAHNPKVAGSNPVPATNFWETQPSDFSEVAFSRSAPTASRCTFHPNIQPPGYFLNRFRYPIFAGSPIDIQCHFRRCVTSKRLGIFEGQTGTHDQVDAGGP